MATSRSAWSPFGPAADAPGIDRAESPTPATTPPDHDPNLTSIPVTDSDTRARSALRTPHSENTDSEDVTEVSGNEGSSETPHSALNSAPDSGDTPSPSGGASDEVITFKDAVGQWLRTSAAPALSGLRPPMVWTQPPASLKDLATYAKEAPWAARTGPIRVAGRVWCWLVAVPVSTLAYYLAWLCQRPSRLITVFVLYAVLTQTTPGEHLPWLWH